MYGGGALLIAGIFSIFMPIMAALSTMWIFGWLLVICGLLEITYAFHLRFPCDKRLRHSAFLWLFVSANITLLGGVMILIFPSSGIAVLSLLIAGVLLLSGAGRLLVGLYWKPYNGWRWMIWDGLISLIIGGSMLLSWPDYSLAYVGILTGLAFISSGIWRITYRPKQHV
ncbi:hypothetical protein WH50_22660 [Pokkaliibacter plantistimulans]|uniref:Acid-resistance membrane protein n=2 Tax=Pokkaliibacter plantistimulans TaxID=1635171 RepID=A0ABX5LU44_9GAMM|nr:hypothetical protein WH50_22660 [Pokkaliibacter plantistimulans]